MKRPLATAVTALLISQAAVFLLHRYIHPLHLLAVVLFALALFGLHAALRKKKTLLRGLIAVAVCAAVGIVGAYCVMVRDIAAFTQLRGNEELTAELRVTRVDRLSRGVYVTADLLQPQYARGADVDVAFFTVEQVQEGDGLTVLLTTDLYAQSPDGEGVLFDCEDVHILQRREGEHKATFLLARLRNYMRKTLQGYLAGDAGDFAAALLTGDKSLLGAEIRVAFTRSGLSHLLVVSGLHVSVLLLSLDRMLKKMRLREELRLALFLLCAVFLAGFYGLTPSVVRACVMSGMTCVAGFVGRRTDGFTSLSAAALVIMLLDVRSVQSLSFLLSYGCCFAIVVVFPQVETHIKSLVGERPSLCRRAAAAVLRALALTLTVSAVTLPILLLSGLSVSLVAPAANIFVLWCMPLLLTTALLTVLIGSVRFLWFFAALFALVCGVAANFILAVAKFFAAFPLANVSAALLSPAFRVVASVAVIGILAGFLHKKKLKRCVLQLCAVLLLAACATFADAALCPSSVRFAYGSLVYLKTRDAHVLFAEEMDVSDIHNAAGDCAAWVRETPNCVILLKEPSDGEAAALRDVFPAAKLVVLGKQTPVAREGDIEAELLADGTVLFTLDGVRVAASSGTTLVDAQVCWFDAETVDAGPYSPDTDYILFGETPHGTKNVHTYGFYDVVDVRVKNDSCKVVYR